jgi:RimJ/RimL family protein N-acetyltransferase
MQQPTLKTARLILRPFDLGDAAAVQRLAGDRAIADTTLLIPHPYQDGMAEEWISAHGPKFEAGEMAVFAVVLRETGELVGAVGLGINRRFDRAEMGYWVGKPYWRRGYCTEAAKAGMGFGFANYNLHRVFATHFVRNPASGRVMQKLGMTYEGTLRQHAKRWERFEDLKVYGVLRSEWEKACGSG